MKPTTPTPEEKTKRIKTRLRRNHWKREPMWTRDFLRLPKGKYELTDESHIYEYILEKGEYYDGSTSYIIQDKQDSFRLRMIFLHEDKEPVFNDRDRETGHFRTTLTATVSVSGFSFHAHLHSTHQRLYFVKKIKP